MSSPPRAPSSGSAAAPRTRRHRRAAASSNADRSPDPLSGPGGLPGAASRRRSPDPGTAASGAGAESVGSGASGEVGTVLLAWDAEQCGDGVHGAAAAKVVECRGGGRDGGSGRAGAAIADGAADGAAFARFEAGEGAAQDGEGLPELLVVEPAQPAVDQAQQ